MTQMSLLEAAPVVAVHCFFGCKHIVRDESPAAAHSAMERHYAEQHALNVAQIVGST